MIKKVLLLISFLLYRCLLFSLSLSDVINIAFERNLDIKNALSNYESAVLSSKTLNGVYSPLVSVSSSTKLSEQEGIDSNPKEFSSQITYSQPIPGGATISTTGTYSSNSQLTGEDCFLFQYPSISLSLSQSLLPFWVQGTIHDPAKLSTKQQVEYYYNQLMYTKRNVIQTLIQNYVNVIVYKNETEIYKNSIELLNEQIAAMYELKKSGSINQTRITELENSKWTYQQNLISAESNYNTYLLNFKTIINHEIEIENLPNTFSDIQSILSFVDVENDPLKAIYELKIDMLKTSRILEKQSSAPTLNLSIEPNWSLPVVKKADWKDAWSSDDKVSPTWTASVSVNLSPLLSAAVKHNKKQYEINYEIAQKSYEGYLQQKTFVKTQYQALYDNYLKQNESVTKLLESGLVELKDYKELYFSGAISKLDYDSVKTRVENCKLNKDCIALQEKLYEFLLLSYK